MKIYLILIACVQALNTPLKDTCIAEPLYEPFENIQSCLAYVDNFKYTLRTNTDLYITGFCTTKNAIGSS